MAALEHGVFTGYEDREVPAAIVDGSGGTDDTQGTFRLDTVPPGGGKKARP